MPSPETVLAEHRFTAGMNEGHLRRLASCIDSDTEWDPGAEVIRAGDEADHCHLLVSGSVLVTVESPGRGRRPVQTLRGGDVLGWSWLFPPHRWAFDAVAMDRARALVLDGARLRLALDEDPAFGLEVVRRVALIIADRLNATRIQMLDLYGTRG